MFWRLAGDGVCDPGYLELPDRTKSTLLLGSADRGVLIAKVQEIQRLLNPLLNPKTKV